MDELRYIEDALRVAEETARWACLAHDAVERLRAAALGEEAEPFSAQGTRLLQASARLYGIPTRHRQLRFVIGNFADELAEDIAGIRAGGGKSVAAFAPPSQAARWQGLGIMPRGAYHETARTLALAAADADLAEKTRQIARCNLALAYQARLASCLLSAVEAGKDASPFALPAIDEAARIGEAAVDHIAQLNQRA